MEALRVKELAFSGKREDCREVAGAGTKGRYDQRLPSVSFTLGLNLDLIEQGMSGLSGRYCIFQFSVLLWRGQSLL